MPTLAQRLREEGRNEARNEAIYEWKLEVARRLLREGAIIEQIVRITGLSEEQLKKAFSEK